MAGQFESLLLDVSAKAERVAALVEAFSERLNNLEKDVKELRERTAEIRTDQKWDHVERRKVDDRLGSGDQTFQRLILEVNALKRDFKSFKDEAADLKRIAAKTSERRWTFWKIVLEAGIPLVISGVVSGVAWLVMRGGSS